MKIKSLNHLIRVENIPFEINEERVLRELRIPILKSLKEMPEQSLAQAIKKAIDQAYSLIEGKGCYLTFPLIHDEKQGTLLHEAPQLFKNERIQKLLQNCDYVTLLLSTIGPKLEKKVDEIKQAEPADAYYLETVGGWMADYMIDKVDGLIEPDILKWGYQRTMRYSPGYGTWELNVQTDMLRLLEGDKLGVDLTDTFIMIPRKSVTAVIGWEKKIS